MHQGGALILLEGFSPREFLPALARYRATSFSAVPTIYAILNNLPDAEQYDLSSLRVCICGAAPMPVEVFARFEQTYRAFILEGYGLSEGTCVSTLNPLDDRPRKIGSIGVALPGQEVRIVDDHGIPTPVGTVGEIVIRGPNVMQGYYKNPEATAATIRDGWLYTGDLGFCDAEGYFYIVGRKKEMIIRGGENIYPREIEEMLYRHPAVVEAAVGPARSDLGRTGCSVYCSPCWRGGECCRDCRLLSGEPGGLQVSAGNRVRRCSPQDGNGQDPEEPTGGAVPPAIRL